MGRMTLLIVFAALLQGCYTRVIVVPSGKAVLIGEELKDVKILTKDGDGNLIEGRGTIPAGWIAAPLKDKKNG